MFSFYRLTNIETTGFEKGLPYELRIIKYELVMTVNSKTIDWINCNSTLFKLCKLNSN